MSILEAHTDDTSATEDRTVGTDGGSCDLRVQPAVTAPRRRTRVIRRLAADLDGADGGSREQDPTDNAGHWEDAATAQMAYVGVHRRR